MCVIEDDGVVAYAYLLVDRKIVSDLWLYNQATTPRELPWQHGGKPPCLNPAEFVDIKRMSAPLDSTDFITVTWRGENEVIGVEIELRGIRYGSMSVAAKPGMTIAAKRDGPLALVMQ